MASRRATDQVDFMGFNGAKLLLLSEGSFGAFVVPLAVI